MRLSMMLTFVLLASLVALAMPGSARPLPPVNQTCVGQPGAVAVCITSGIGGTCVSAGVGLQGAWVCQGPNGLRVCSSLYTALYGNCPTDLLGAADPSIADPVCIGKPSLGQTCVGHNYVGDLCVSQSAGLQGGYVCLTHDGRVRVCTSAYTALYGYCPTDLVIG